MNELASSYKMNSSSWTGFAEQLPASIVTRNDLVSFLWQIRYLVCADYYMLLDLTSRKSEQARIVACNWIYDAIDIVGLETITRLASNVRNSGQSRQTSLLSAPELASLRDQGHVDVQGISLRVGRRRFVLLLSASQDEKLVAPFFKQVELLCSYALSSMSGKADGQDEQDPLTDRERECLSWVSEGKTTEEIAMILSVSPNTANSYLTNAMQKLGVRNRALAIATAIRHGLI